MNIVSHPNMLLDSPLSYNSGFQVLQNLFDFFSFFLVLFGNYSISFLQRDNFYLKLSSTRAILWRLGSLHDASTIGPIRDSGRGKVICCI